MISFLEVINECSSPALSTLLLFVKRTLNLIHILVPILLLISLSMNFAKLMMSPENKKLIPKIRNSAIAAVVIFFIPMLLDLVMSNVSNNYTISACWNERVDSNYTMPTYNNSLDNNKKNPIYNNPSDYEKGQPKPEEEKNPSDSESSSESDDLNPSGSLNTTPGKVTGDMQVHFINPNSRVDAIYIKVGNESIFIDGGFKKDGYKEIEYLQKIGVKSIDYYIASHSHKDHVEAAPPIISKYNVKKVLVGRETCDGSGSTPCSWHAIKIFANEQKLNVGNASLVTIKPGDVFYVGGLKVTCIGPLSVNNSLARGDTKQNYNSLVLRMEYGSTSFLMTGDNSSSSVIKEINSKYPGMLKVNVLKNAHHNGCTSDSAYQAIGAEYVVFTTKKDSLPSTSCINKIKKFGAKYYYIVADGYSGNVVFTSDGSKISVYDKYNP